MIRKTLYAAVAAIMLPLSASADVNMKWCADADGKIIPLEEIECLLAADNSKTIDVLLLDGKMISDVPSVSFLFTDMPSSVGEVTGGTEVIEISNTLHISCLAPETEVKVFNLGGVALTGSKTSAEGTCDLDISALAPGLYILNIGAKSIEFMKR